MLETKKQKQMLLIANALRIAFTLFVLYIDIPIFTKIILIMASDSFDCGIPDILWKDWTDCNKTSIFYQKMDKITDTISNILLIFYVLNNGKLSHTSNVILVLLFVYRLIGTSMYLLKNDRSYLFYYPNFFLEICLGFFVIQYFPSLRYYTLPIMTGIFIYKIMQEYYLHIYLPKKHELISNNHLN